MTRQKAIMKLPVLASLCLAFTACSESEHQPPTPRSYSVTFAVALVPDSLLAQYGGSFSREEGHRFTSLDDRYRLAAYVLENIDKFPVCRQDDGWTPLVATGKTSQMFLNSEVAAKTFSLDSTGVSLDRFSIYVAVEEESSTGQISCNWGCEFRLTLKYPIGNSTDHGGSRNSGYTLYSDKPDMTPFFNFEGQTLWMIVGLTQR